MACTSEGVRRNTSLFINRSTVHHSQLTRRIVISLQYPTSKLNHTDISPHGPESSTHLTNYHSTGGRHIPAGGTDIGESLHPAAADSCPLPTAHTCVPAAGVTTARVTRMRPAPAEPCRTCVTCRQIGARRDDLERRSRQKLHCTAALARRRADTEISVEPAKSAAAASFSDRCSGAQAPEAVFTDQAGSGGGGCVC